MSELKPCPFCGSEHVLCTKPTIWQVWCTDCKCVGPWKIERKDAIEAWNRRVGDSGDESRNVMQRGEQKND